MQSPCRWSLFDRRPFLPYLWIHHICVYTSVGPYQSMCHVIVLDLSHVDSFAFQSPVHVTLLPKQNKIGHTYIFPYTSLVPPMSTPLAAGHIHICIVFCFFDIQPTTVYAYTWYTCLCSLPCRCTFGRHIYLKQNNISFLLSFLHVSLAFLWLS